MPLSLENPDQSKLIDHLVNGTLNITVARKIPGVIIESEHPLKLRYKRVENDPQKSPKPTQFQSRQNITQTT